MALTYVQQTVIFRFTIVTVCYDDVSSESMSFVDFGKRVMFSFSMLLFVGLRYGRIHKYGRAVFDREFVIGFVQQGSSQCDVSR